MPMTKLIYVDTNIYIDFFENRTEGFKPFGELARQLFDRALDCEFKIIVSQVVVEEIKDNGYTDVFNDFLNNLKSRNKILPAVFTNKDRIKANELKDLRKTPYKDTCHVILAQKVNAECLITRNIKDYENISDIIFVTLPELI